MRRARTDFMSARGRTGLDKLGKRQNHAKSPYSARIALEFTIYFTCGRELGILRGLLIRLY